MGEKIEITLEPICLPNKCPLIKITTSDQSQTIDLKERTVIPFILTLQNRCFDIEFLNKERNDTKVVNGQIIEDLAVIIKRIDHRGFDFWPEIDELGTYTTNDNQIITGTGGFMAFKGVFKFKIQKPLFILSRDMAILHG
jgi:hypothetical protein